MHDIRNPAGRLVCQINEAAGIIEIYTKGIMTRIQWKPGGKVRITHTRKELFTA